MRTAAALPADLLPADGRFGSGPSRVRREQLDRLLAAGPTLLGTSHRQDPVRSLVGRVREGVAALLGAPDGYEVVLGNGGATMFWDIAALQLVESLPQHLVHGEFSGKFAAATARAPFLTGSVAVQAEPGLLAEPYPDQHVDAYAWPHNETSTGVVAPVRRVAGAAPGSLVLVDATSAAGGVAVDLSQTDAYYFAPQKCLGSDGGLWLAVLSPAAMERAERLAAGERWVPESLSLPAAVTASRKNQTLNTPAVTTLVLLAAQLDWLLERGGLDWATARTTASSGLLYDWAEASDYARPFVADPAHRSPVVVTVDLEDTVAAAEVAATLRTNGVVDVEPYRKLGRNQLRVGTFPSVEPDDVAALTRCIDHLVDAGVGRCRAGTAA